MDPVEISAGSLTGSKGGGGELWGEAGKRGLLSRTLFISALSSA